jgi:pimeloyl-ACP methyl ester carboxylesterase
LSPSHIDVDGRRIAYLQRPGAGPGVVWLGGFRSEMTATKASRLDAWAARTGRAFLRFDYSGHGQSSERFEDGTLSSWLADALGAIRALTKGPQILVGSSMGGHIALLACRALRAAGEGARIAGLVLIAPAPDFTERLMWDAFTPEIRETILREGVYHEPSPYSPQPTPLTRALIEDGRKHLVLGGTIETGAPVHILHGTADPDVPWELSVELMGRLLGERTALTLVKDGDHRLSTEADLALLERTVEAIVPALPTVGPAC